MHPLPQLATQSYAVAQASSLGSVCVVSAVPGPEKHENYVLLVSCKRLWATTAWGSGATGQHRFPNMSRVTLLRSFKYINVPYVADGSHQVVAHLHPFATVFPNSAQYYA